jgi:flagellar assembly protein FliH
MNIWSNSQATSLGSFAIERVAPVFTPWGSDEGPLQIEPALDLEQLQAEAFAQGFEQGRRSVELEFETERDALARLAESLDVLRPQETNALALLLSETVDRLIRQIVGQVEVDGALLAARAEAAAALIGQETDAARLRVNPGDLPLIEGARIPVEIVADPAIERGGLLLETGQGWIEDGPTVRLDRLRAELDRMGAPA